MGTTFEPHREKTGLRGFRPGLTHLTKLYKHRRWLEAGNFAFKKERICTVCVAKTKALISCAVTAQLICAFVFAKVKLRFSHDAAHLLMCKLFQYRYLLTVVPNIIAFICIGCSQPCYWITGVVID